MTKHTNNAPLAKLASAESALVATIDQATARLDAIGTADLAGALARLQASADAARARLASAYSRLNSIVGDVLDNLADMAGALAEQLEAPTVPVSAVPTNPAPVTVPEA